MVTVKIVGEVAVNLTQQQLEGDNPPFICNVRFPVYIELDPNRDCDQIAVVLNQRYPEQFGNLQKAEEFVNKQRQKKQRQKIWN